MTQKLTDSVAREVLRLYHDQTEVTEIAHLLNLKKMQITAIIAHSHVATDLHEAPSSNQVRDIGADDIESQPAVEFSRLWVTATPCSPCFELSRGWKMQKDERDLRTNDYVVSRTRS